MNLYDSLTEQKREPTPFDGTLKMYVCGVTPYASTHVGHAMRAVVFDVLRRYLEYRGRQVKHVENFTDIDDKMIAGAAEMGISVQELAERNIADYLEEMDALNVQRAHVYPRATEEIPGIQEMNQRPHRERHGIPGKRRRLLPGQAEQGVRKTQPSHPGHHESRGQN